MTSVLRGFFQRLSRLPSPLSLRWLEGLPAWPCGKVGRCARGWDREAGGGIPRGDQRRQRRFPRAGDAPRPVPRPSGEEVGLWRGGAQGQGEGAGHAERKPRPAGGRGARLWPSSLLPSPDAARSGPGAALAATLPQRGPGSTEPTAGPSPRSAGRPGEADSRGRPGSGVSPGRGPRSALLRSGLCRAPPGRPSPGAGGVSARAAGPALRRRRAHRSGAAAARGQRAEKTASSLLEMGNSYAGQLKTTRFEEVLHNSIEASLRSNSLVPRPVFSQLYLEAEQQLSALEGGSRVENEEEEEEGEGGLEQNCPPNPYQMQPPPEGCCTTDGFCQAGKDLRLVSISSEPIDVPAGFLLVGAKSPSLPDHLLVCAVDKRFLPDDDGHNALLGFSGNCVGCGKKGFCYFTEFSSHMNLKVTTQPKKQKHLKYYLIRNAQGALTKGPLICWKGSELRSRQASASACSSSLFPPLESSGLPAPFPSEPGPGTTPSIPLGAPQAGPAHDHASLTTAVGPAVFNGKDSPKHQLLVKHSLSTAPRPSALGILSNSGPPKKRHKGWSPESPSAADGGHPQGGGNRAKYESTGVTCMPQVGLVGPASVTFPIVASGEPVSVPDNLLKICKAKPVIFKGHGHFPYLCGNLNDVVVSPLLYTCYQNSQSISRAYGQYGASTIQPISEEMQLLLTVYYLVQLAADQVPLMEDLEQIFLRSWRESHLTEIRQYQQAPPQPVPPAPGAVAPVTSAQLPWLAGLAASSCNDSVHIIECTYSLAEGLSEMFRLLIEGKLAKTNYVVIICACRSAAIDSCIAVTGKYQARILSESLLSPAEYQKEVNSELVTGKVDSLGAFFSTLCPEGDIDILLDKFHQENQGQISSSLTASSITKSASLDVGGTRVCTSYQLEPHHIRPFQLAVAQKLLSHVCSIADSSTQNLDLGSFEKVDFLICIPPSEVTYQQTLFHVWHSGVLLELGLQKEHMTKQRVEQYVLKLDAEAQTKFKSFLQNSFQNPHTLFVLIHDHAHWDLVSSTVHDLYSQSDPSVGLVDRLLNCKEVKEAPNIVVLHVTSFPYALQTQHTLISPYNEIHWPASYSNGVDLYPENKKYFGLSEFIESTLSGHSLPLLRYDSSFEAMVTALGKSITRPR
ncbi:protein GREB1 isoform X7 [Tursiops truncatus]|uniref:protein GREB1 isoform X7 n=1 Tax=Tursiops truncatus TaxID=9739 RepID=UPI003CCF3636